MTKAFRSGVRIADPNGLPSVAFLHWMREVSSDASAGAQAAAAEPEPVPVSPITAFINGINGIDVTGTLAQGGVVIGLETLYDTGITEGLKKISRDEFGRVEGTADATASDLPYVDTLAVGATDTQGAVTKALGALPYFSDTAPDPALHPVWVDTIAGVLYAWWESQWVEFGTVGGSGSALVPYYIAAGQSYTVPLYKQALFHETISVDGSLVVDGMLIEV